MPTKQELLNTLSGYTKEKLERLVNYSGLLLIPEKDLLVNATMSQMLDKAFELADAVFPEWTDRSHGDFGRYLVELMALQSEKDFWYINNYAFEAFLDKMKSYRNAYYRALTLGYSPVLFTSGSCTVRLTLGPVPSDIDIEPGDFVIRNTAQDIILSNSEAFSISQNFANQDVDVVFSEGRYETKTANFNGRGFRITNSPVDISSISLTVAGLDWSRVSSFAELTGSSKSYAAFPESDASVTLLFGDNTYGLRPNIGDEVVSSYRVGGGSRNTFSGLSFIVLEAPPTLDVQSNLQVTPFSGGTDLESLSSIKANSPVYFRTQGRGINDLDTQGILNSQPEVFQSKAVIWGSTLQFYVIPSDGSVASPTLLSDLEDLLEPVILMNFSPAGLATSYVDLSPLKVTLFVLPGYDLADVTAQAQELLVAYTNPIGLAKYGQSFNFNLVTFYLVSNITGLQNVVFDEVQGLPASSFPSGRVFVGFNKIMQKLDIDASPSVSVSGSGGLITEQGDLTVQVEYSTI